MTDKEGKLAGKIVVYSLGGVGMPGRATTIMAGHYDKPSEELDRFREWLYDQCETSGPYEPVVEDDLKDAFERYESDNGLITTAGEMADFLTRARHDYKAFPGSAQTMDSKNRLFAGISLKEVGEALKDVEWNPGFPECVEKLGEAGATQLFLSRTNGAAVHHLADKIGRETGQEFDWVAVRPYVIDEEGENRRIYTEDMIGAPDIFLEGSLDDFDKRGELDEYLRDLGIGYEDLVVVDDVDKNSLRKWRERGAEVYGFRNSEDDLALEEHEQEMTEDGISVVRDDASGIADRIIRVA